jgi:hypothetical protein
MARPYSMDLHGHALARVQEGESVRVAARALSISPSSAVKWSRRFRATPCGVTGSRPHGSSMVQSTPSCSASVEKVLIPTLKPGDIVILDNLASHKGKAVRAAIRAAGARLFFSRPIAPISTRSILRRAQEVFAKLKHLLRKAAERTLDATWKRIGVLLDCFLDECQAYLANAGYGST